MHTPRTCLFCRRDWRAVLVTPARGYGMPVICLLHFTLFITIPFPIFFVSVSCSQLDVPAPLQSRVHSQSLSGTPSESAGGILDVGHVDEAMKIKLIWFKATLKVATREITSWVSQGQTMEAVSGRVPRSTGPQLAPDLEVGAGYRQI